MLGPGLVFCIELSELLPLLDDNGRDVAGVGDGFLKDTWLPKGLPVTLSLPSRCLRPILGAALLTR